MMLDGFTVIVIAATLNIITLIITVAYCFPMRCADWLRSLSA